MLSVCQAVITAAIVLFPSKERGFHSRQVRKLLFGSSGVSIEACKVFEA